MQKTASEKSKRPSITINGIGVSDIVEALGKAVRDFAKAPFYGMFFGAVYCLGGWLLFAIAYALRMPFLVFPAAFGFALIAPFAAAGTYEISRRLEIGAPLSWRDILGAVRVQGGRDLGWMALVTTFAFYIWVDWAGITYLLFFGFNLMDPWQFAQTVFFTTEGLQFLALGTMAGAIMATIVFSVTAMSFPLLLDRNVDFVTAMVTSVRTVIRNPITMALWAGLIAITLLVSIALGFVPLLVTLPILGHMTWHLYRRIVVHPDAVGAIAA